MNTMEITAKDFETDKEVIVTPMAVFGLGDLSTIFITDATGRGLWLDCDLDWRIDAEEGDIDDAERIEVSSVPTKRNGKSPRMRSSPTAGSVSETSIRSMVTGIP